MKKIAIMLLTCCALASAMGAEQKKWFTNLSQAMAQAQKDNKMVVLDFTGSDWCGWCIKFKKEALDTQEFSDYAAKNLVLVELDFPRKTPQTADVKKYNKMIAEHYNVTGYPTFIVLNKDGKEIGRQPGYEKGGAKAFIARIEKFKSKN